MIDGDAAALAERLAGVPVRGLAAVRGGGNNRLYRVETAAGTYALKRYPDDSADGPARATREFAALTFLWEFGERRIPEPVALDVDVRAGLYGWIEGVPAGDPGAAEIDELAAFAAMLHGARERPGAAALQPAREAVDSRAELEWQVERRLDRLAREAVAVPGLEALLADIRRLAAALRRDDAAPLDPAARTLSPSDFGLHNAVRTPAGLVFLDFEYFGWDDPVKLTADVVWHPGMALGPELRQKFYAAAADIYRVNPGFRGRFERDAPLYGLRWALIVLNEFLPAVWERRLAAAAAALDVRAARERQLAKAVVLVERVRGGRILR